MVPLRPQRLQDFEAAFFRHHDVQNNTVIRAEHRIVQRILSVENGIHLIVVVFQNGRQGFGKLLLIFRQ